MEAELVKMSPKGQLVVPQEIREKERFSPGDRFVPLAMKEGVLFKRVKLPKMKIEFDKLAKEIQEQFRKNQVTQNDVAEAVKWARKK